MEGKSGIMSIYHLRIRSIFSLTTLLQPLLKADLDQSRIMQFLPSFIVHPIIGFLVVETNDLLVHIKLVLSSRGFEIRAFGFGIGSAYQLSARRARS